MRSKFSRIILRLISLIACLIPLGAFLAFWSCKFFVPMLELQALPENMIWVGKIFKKGFVEEVLQNGHIIIEPILQKVVFRKMDASNPSLETIPMLVYTENTEEKSTRNNLMDILQTSDSFKFKDCRVLLDSACWGIDNVTQDNGAFIYTKNNAIVISDRFTNDYQQVNFSSEIEKIDDLIKTMCIFLFFAFLLATIFLIFLYGIISIIAMHILTFLALFIYFPGIPFYLTSVALCVILPILIIVVCYYWGFFHKLVLLSKITSVPLLVFIVPSLCFAFLMGLADNPNPTFPNIDMTTIWLRCSFQDRSKVAFLISERRSNDPINFLLSKLSSLLKTNLLKTKEQ